MRKEGGQEPVDKQEHEEQPCNEESKVRNRNRSHKFKLSSESYLKVVL